MENILEYTISFIFSPILFLIIIICYIYRCCIELVLAKQLGPHFGGLLKGKDARMARNFPIINSLQLIDFRTNNSHKVRKILLDSLKPVFESGQFPKITCVIEQQYGYYYLRKNEYNWDQVVTTFSVGGQSDSMEIPQLQSFIGQLANQRMVGKENALIEYLVSDKPLTNSQTFAVIIRIHHALSDGPASMHFVTYIAKTDLFKMETKLFDKAASTSKMAIVLDILSTIFFLTFGTFTFLRKSLIRSKEVNPFYVERTGGKKVAQWIWDDNKIMVGKVKEIRKKTGCSFTEIVLTCIVASLRQFATRRNCNLDSLTTVQTIMTKKPDPSQLPQLQNDFGINSVQFPVDSELPKLLDNIKKAYDASKKSLFIQTADALMRVPGSVLPSFFDRYLTIKNVTLGLTNMSSALKSTVFGYELKLVNFFIPNADFLNFTLGIVCYDNALCISALVDEKCVGDAEGLREILQGSFNNIAQFHKEIN